MSRVRLRRRTWVIEVHVIVGLAFVQGEEVEQFIAYTTYHRLTNNCHVQTKHGMQKVSLHRAPAGGAEAPAVRVTFSERLDCIGEAIVEPAPRDNHHAEPTGLSCLTQDRHPHLMRSLVVNSSVK